MAFQKPFRNFDLKNDVVFGIDTPDRQNFLYYHLKLGIAQRKRDGVPIFIDGFQNLGKPLDPKDKPHIPLKIQQQHRELVLEAYPESISPDAAHGNALDRKKSKGSLYWAARMNIHVHFVMYKLASEESQRWIVTKTSERGGPLMNGDQPRGKKPDGPINSDAYWNKQRQTTGSELRWIYRMRNSKVAEVIQFWKSDDGKTWEQCTPPWTWSGAIGTLWSSYQPTNDGFYNSMLSDGAV